MYWERFQLISLDGSGQVTDSQKWKISANRSCWLKPHLAANGPYNLCFIFYVDALLCVTKKKKIIINGIICVTKYENINGPIGLVK